MAKIKLLKPLWQHKPDEVINETKDRAIWAINKGYAVKMAEPRKKTKIDPEAEKIQDK